MEIDRRAVVTGALALSATALFGLPAHAVELNLGSSSSIKVGTAKLFASGVNRIVVYRASATKFTAFRATCPVDSTALSRSNIIGSRITCSKDKLSFNLVTGKSTSAQLRKLETVKLRISKGFLIATLAASATSTPVASVAPSPTESAKPLIASSKVPLGSGIRVDSTVGSLLVVQPSAGVFRAFSAICTHAGCEVTELGSSEMVCTCHNSAFSTVDGAVTGGPARRALKQYAVVERSGQIYLQ